MKKSTVLIVAITFVLSVLIVGVFGMRLMSYNTRIYVKTITPTGIITNTEENPVIRQTTDANGNPVANDYYATVYYSEGLVVRIDYEITPADATNNTVTCVITNSNETNPVATLDGLTIYVHRTGAIRLNYRAADGSGTQITFYLYIRQKT